MLCSSGQSLFAAEERLCVSEMTVGDTYERVGEKQKSARRGMADGVENGGRHCSVSTENSGRKSTSGDFPDQSWGIAAAGRIASSPFALGGGNGTSESFVPMFFFENEYFFLRGTEGGVHLFTSPGGVFQFSGLSRLRFIDIPTDAQKSSQYDSLDFGFQLRYAAPEIGTVDFEIMTDKDYRFHGNIRLKKSYTLGNWQLSPKATLRYKDSDFNTTYYALSDFYDQDIGGGLDISVGLDARYHLVSNFYLLGSASVTRLDHQAYHSRAVEDRYTGEALIGLGFFENQSDRRQSTPSNPPYIRISHGWATPSNLGDIVAAKTEKDPYNDQLTSFFYGHPLADNLLGLPFDIYLTPGIVHHWPSSKQSASTEYVAAIKAYYTFRWPTQWRFGVAEGLSYIDSVTHIETANLKEKHYTPSRLLNYLDFSFDVNIGDLLNRTALRSIWAGYALHHRSGIFEAASQYGRVKGGSNYNTFYLQFEF